MDTYSAAEAARRLSTSVPRVQRAITRAGMTVARHPGGRVRLTESQLQALRVELGAVPPVGGLSRIETRVLAVLARAPRGLVSARAVARRAGVSPTAAGVAVRSLTGRGLVRKESQWVASGRAREIELTFAEVTAAGWPSSPPGSLRRTFQPRPRCDGQLASRPGLRTSSGTPIPVGSMCTRKADISPSASFRPGISTGSPGVGGLLPTTTGNRRPEPAACPRESERWLTTSQGAQTGESPRVARRPPAG